MCPCVECIHHSDKTNTCKAKEVAFTYRNMATLNEGRVDMWVCKQYELSEDVKRIFKEIDEYLRERVNK